MVTTVTVKKRDRLFSLKEVTELQLAYYSVKEYLVSKRIGESFKDDFKESRAKVFIVQISLAYLVHVEQGLFLKQIGMAFPFAQYSAR